MITIIFPDEQQYQQKYAEWLNNHQPFHWFVEFYGIMQHGGFDVIIGNPPYVEYSKVRKEYQVHGYDTIECGNLYAVVLERSFSIANEKGFCGMIVQLSSVCTDRMSPLQQKLVTASSQIWLSNYDDRPAKLFDGLEHIRASIIISQLQSSQYSQPIIYATNLIRWYTEQRSTLFHAIAYQNISGLNILGSLPKVGELQIKQIISKIRGKSKKVNEIYRSGSQYKVYYYRSPLYWIRGMDFLPVFESSTANRSIHHFKDFQVINEIFINLVGCLINSSLFYLWFIVYGNGRNVALRDIQTFPCDLEQLYLEQGNQLGYLFKQLMEDYNRHSKTKTRKDGITFQEFYPSKSKPIIDEIDRVLAKHYGFTDEELDFIINYNIKYRMGRNNGEEDEE